MSSLGRPRGGSDDAPDLNPAREASSTFTYGAFLNAPISFVLVAVVLFFLVVKPVNALVARARRNEEATTRPCPECLTEIPLEATRCSACTTAVPKAA